MVWRSSSRVAALELEENPDPSRVAGTGGPPRLAFRGTASSPYAAPAAASKMAATAAPATPVKAVEDKAMADAVAVEELPDEVKRASSDELAKLSRMLENEIKALKNDVARLNLEQKREREHIKENTDKIKLNRQLPYLVGNVVEVCCND